MMGYYMICLVLVLGVTADDCRPSSCPDTGVSLIPIPSDCTKFISCLNGKVTYRNCPDGESFDKQIQICIKSEFANCESCDSSEESEEKLGSTPIRKQHQIPNFKPLQQHLERADNISKRCIDNSVTPVTCPADIGDDRLMAHPDDCRLFYVCVAIGLPPVCRDCPANLHFNPNKKVCDHPEVAGCRSHLLPLPTAVPDQPKSDLIKKIEAYYKSKKYEQCVQQGSIYADLRPDPKNCSKYYVCDSGSLIPMDCPQGLHFNERLKVCDYPQSARCQLDNSTQINPAKNPVQNSQVLPKSSGQCTQGNWPYADLRPDPENCSKYYVCDWNTLISMSCPEGLHFSTSMKVCDLPQNARCQLQNSTEVYELVPVNYPVVQPRASQCEQNSGPDADLRPDPKDCTKYYVCEAGDLISMSCPDGLHFNAVLKVCDLPENAKCQSDYVADTSTSEIKGSETVVKLDEPVQCEKYNGVYADLRPDPSDCNKYLVCDWGVLIPMSCPEGLHFNDKIKVCDSPYKANCPLFNPSSNSKEKQDNSSESKEDNSDSREN